jgi:hypothetical protein
MSSVTREEVLQIINEQIYFTQVQNTQFTDLTLSEKIGTLVKSSLGRINTDNNTVWYNEPVKSTLINKGNIYTSEILPFSTTRNYYTIVSVQGKKYISSVTLTNLVTNLCNIPLNSVLTGTSVIPPSSPDTANTSYSDSRDVIQGDFNASGFLTRYPRNAWVFFNYWKKQLTGTKSRLTGNTDFANTANTGTYPNMQNDRSVILTLNSSNEPNPDATYNNVIPNTTIMNDLRDYQTIGLISNTLVDQYFNNLELPDGVTRQMAQLNEELYNKIQSELISKAEPLDIVLGVPTISTWNGVPVDTNDTNHTDNISFYNPLLANSLNELFGYSSQGQGNGYAVTAPLSSGNRRNINATAGVTGTITESPFSFSSLEGFFMCKGLKHITAPLGSSLISTLPISAAVPPVITAVRYTGETLAGSLIQQGSSLPTSGKVDDLFINTSDRKIYRYTGTDWISVGGNDIFKEVGEERTFTERDIAIGKTEFDTDISYALDVSGLVNFNNQIRFNTNTDISINSSVSISGDLTVTGDYIIKGTTSSTNNISVASNKIILNEGLEEAKYDASIEPIESGIIINRAKNDDTPQEPFKIIYTDDREIDDDYLNIGIGDNLQRVATIDASKNHMDGHLVYWNANEGRLDIEMDISKNDSTLFVNKSIRTTGDIYNAVHQDISTSVFPHQDENADVGVWGILNKMFDQPPKFKAKSTDAKSTFFKVEWEKAFSSLRFSHNGTEVPHIERIAIQIRRINEDWNTVDENLPSSQTSYTFLTNGIYGGITISLNELYDVRIYGINLSNSMTYNYLLFENMEVIPPAEPSAPRLVSFDSDVSFNYINVKYSAPETFNIDIAGGELYSDEPALENYKIIYKPEGENGSTEFNTLRNNGNTGLNINEITVLATNNLNHGAENIITKIQHSNATLVYPASRYVLKQVRAKNILNEKYSDNGVASEIVITTPPPPVHYGGHVFPFFTDTNIITEAQQATKIQLSIGTPRTFNIGSTKITNGNYINITTSNPTYSFGVTATQSGVYVNRNADKLGKDYVGEQSDTFVYLYYNIDGTDISYQRLIFNGFNENSAIGSVRYETIENDLDICFNQEPFETRNITSASGSTIADITYRGYGLYGYFTLLSQSNSIGLNTRFQPRSNVQKIGYHVKSFTVDTKRELSLYIDNLDSTLSISTVTTTLLPTNARYCYGIPSIGLFDISVNYTVSNYAKHFLPPDGIISDICLNPLTILEGNNNRPFFASSVNKPTTLIQDNIQLGHKFTNLGMQTNVDRNIFNSAVRIRAYNLNIINGITNGYDVSFSQTIHNDATSFTSATSNEIQSFGQGVYKYDHDKRYTLDLLSDLSSNNFTLPDNQMIYFRGAFYSNNINAFKDYSGYYGDGADHSGKSIIGDFYNSDNYKWLMKRVATNIPTNNGTARRRTIRINGLNLSDLNSSILVFVLQKYTNSNNTIHTYGSTQNYTIWYNTRATFNPDSMSGAVNYDTDQLDSRVGIAQGNSVDLFLDGDSSRRWDIYVRIGVPINNNLAISSISFT